MGGDKRRLCIDFYDDRNFRKRRGSGGGFVAAVAVIGNSVGDYYIIIVFADGCCGRGK